MKPHYLVIFKAKNKFKIGKGDNIWSIKEYFYNIKHYDVTTFAICYFNSVEDMNKAFLDINIVSWTNSLNNNLINEKAVLNNGIYEIQGKPDIFGDYTYYKSPYVNRINWENQRTKKLRKLKFTSLISKYKSFLKNKKGVILNTENELVVKYKKHIDFAVMKNDKKKIIKISKVISKYISGNDLVSVNNYIESKLKHIA